MDSFLQDLRFGWRLLVRTPGFTIAAVLALTLGIGATTAVFTLLDRVVLRPLPYPDPDRLATIWETNDAKALTHERISPVNFMDYRALAQVIDDGAAWWYPQLTLTEPAHEPLRVSAVETSANLFAVLGVQPVLGAGFPASPLFSRERVVVISHRLWRERFASDSAIVGKSIVLNGDAFTVSGVMPAGFQYPNDTDVWQRLTWDMSQHSRGAHFMESVVRLKRGVTVDAANAELRALSTRLGREHASTNADWGSRAVPLAVEVVGFFRPALFALFGAAGFLLVITCTNVAGLLLARATVREREVAVRAAIGAGRARLVRQFVTESAMLAIAGSIGGVTLAVVAVRALVAASPVRVPRVDTIGIDLRLLTFAVAVAGVTALAFGAVPAWLMARRDMQRPLKESGRGAAGGARSTARSVLVTAEVALAVMLLVGAMLLARSFQRLVRQDPGFAGRQTVTAKLDLPYSYQDWSAIVRFYDQLLTALRSDAEIAAAGATNFLPLDAAWRGPFYVDGRPRPRPGEESQSQHQTIDDGYFRALGVPLVEGRFFDVRDTSDAPGVVIVNDVLARRLWPGESPIGRTLQSPMRVVGPLGRSLLKTTTFQVVGVVASVKNAALTRDPEPAIYYSFRQFPFRGLNIIARPRRAPAAALAAIRSAVQRLDPNLPLADARTLDRLVSDATDRPRALMLLMGVFAALALLLAALGVYSVMAYAVSQRTQELSVRLALGAQRRDLVLLVVRRGAMLAAVGCAAGLLGAIGASRALSALLFGVPPTDAVSFAIAVAVSAVTALAACAIPARRAASVDLLRGLRAE